MAEGPVKRPKVYIRIPIGKPTRRHKDRVKYNRKRKHKRKHNGE